MSDTIKYINNNPLVFLIIVILLFLVVWLFYSCSQSEHFGNWSANGQMQSNSSQNPLSSPMTYSTQGNNTYGQITPVPQLPISPSTNPANRNPVLPIQPISPPDPANRNPILPIQPISPPDPANRNPILPIQPIQPISPPDPANRNPILPIQPISPSDPANRNPILPIQPITPTNPSCQSCVPCSPEQLSYDLNKILIASLLRFRTTIRCVNYYLMITPASRCSNILSNPQSSQEIAIRAKDCTTNILVLVEESEVLTEINNYLRDTSNRENTCNLQESLSCRNRLNTTQQTGQEVCPEDYPSCKITKQFPVDFILNQAFNLTQQGDVLSHKYILKGVSLPTGLNNNNAFYFMNRNFRNNISHDTSHLVCADITALPASTIDVNLITTQDPISQKLKTIIRFDTIAGKFLIDIDGKVVNRGMYVGVCKDNTCNMNGKTHFRACLFDKMDDPNVLEFEPITVNYN